jgi:hypothetical protein
MNYLVPPTIFSCIREPVSCQLRALPAAFRGVLGVFTSELATRPATLRQPFAPLQHSKIPATAGALLGFAGGAPGSVALLGMERTTRRPGRPRALLLAALALLGGGGGLEEAAAQARSTAAASAGRAVVTTGAIPSPGARARANTLTSVITLADIGIASGFRFANLGGRREVFVPLPQGADIVGGEIVLTLDDVSAHEARRSLEILANDRTIAAVALDGRSAGRLLRIPVDLAKTRGQFLKLTFVYSGAATQDRCIDVRYVGDSLTIRPESAIELEIPLSATADVATTVGLMPRDVTVILPGRPLAPADLATALSVGRSLAASGRRVSFHNGFEMLSDLARRSDPRRWARGLVVVGTLDDVASQVDSPIATIATAAPVSGFGEIAVIRLAGLPALLVSDTSSAAGRLLASASLAAARGTPAVSIADARDPALPTDRVTFDQLGLAPALAEVFGRADLSVTVAARVLPPATRMARLGLDLQVAPDGTGERAVVSVFVNDRLLGSTVAASGEPTRLDLAIPEGLVGNAANIRAVVQRRSAQGDCRFEPQGHPAQILGSSAIELAPAADRLRDFAELSTRWIAGIDVLLPDSSSRRPEAMLGLASNILNVLSPPAAPIRVGLVRPGEAGVPQAAFLAIGDLPPAGSAPHVRFDRGRVAVVDRSGRSLLDMGGLANGAVAQLLTAAGVPGLWVKPLAADGGLPEPAELRLERGDVAVLDKLGVALALSTERDTLVSIAYPDRTSWLTIADRFRPWLIGGFWVFVTLVFLLGLQNVLRRRLRIGQ